MHTGFRTTVAANSEKSVIHNYAPQMLLKMSALCRSLQTVRATLKSNSVHKCNISVAKLVIDEGGVEPRNADAITLMDNSSFH